MKKMNLHDSATVAIRRGDAVTTRTLADKFNVSPEAIEDLFYDDRCCFIGPLDRESSRKSIVPNNYNSWMLTLRGEDHILYNDLIEADELHYLMRRERKSLYHNLRGIRRKEYCKDVHARAGRVPGYILGYVQKNGCGAGHKLVDRATVIVASNCYSKPKIQGTTVEATEAALSPLLDWMKDNTLPDGTNRNSKLFKNLGIFWVSKGLDDGRIIHESKKLLAKTHDKNYSEILGWARWARHRLQTGKKVEVNLAEVNSWVTNARTTAEVSAS